TRPIRRRVDASRRAPPLAGRTIGASSRGTPTMLITRPIRFGPAAWARIVCPITAGNGRRARVEGAQEAADAPVALRDRAPSVQRARLRASEHRRDRP